MREYTIDVYHDGNLIYDYYGDRIYPPIMLGYYGEEESAELTINLPDDWTGSFYLDWFYSGEWNEGETAYTDTEITYTATPPEIGNVYMRVRVVDGDTTMYSEPIKFVVRV